MDQTGTCCLCGGPYIHFGNNPEPLVSYESGRCCHDCSAMYVLAARLGHRIDPMAAPEHVVRLYLQHLYDRIDASKAKK